jgi:hypothetical protein
VRELDAGAGGAAPRRRAGDDRRHSSDVQIRQELSALSGWPTIPQIFIRGELIGGADITEELAESGELEEKLESALGAGYRSVWGA